MKTPLSDRIIQVLFRISVWGMAVLLFGALHAARRIWWFDQFIIPSGSMVPTLLPGDRILVNKRILGARIYTGFDFSEGAPLEARRTRGRRRLKPGDIVVFNHPMPYRKGEMAFKINRVYAKRVIGTPGDTISIRQGFYHNSRHAGILGAAAMQEALSALPDSVFDDRGMRFMPSFLGMDFQWTIRDAGPLVVPAKGLSVQLDSVSFAIYRSLMEYETKQVWQFDPATSRAYNLQGDSLSRYTFTTDCCFTGGDCVTDSNDSRYWGFVPEDFVVGVATRISISTDPETGLPRLRRWGRRINRLQAVGIRKQSAP